MRVFHSSILEAMKSLRDEMESIKSLLKKWTWIRPPLLLQSLAQVNRLILCPQTLSHRTDEAMDEAMDFDLYGPLLPWFGSSVRLVRTTRTGVFG